MKSILRKKTCNSNSNNNSKGVDPPKKPLRKVSSGRLSELDEPTVTDRTEESTIATEDVGLDLTKCLIQSSGFRGLGMLPGFIQDSLGLLPFALSEVNPHSGKINQRDPYINKLSEHFSCFR